jgi:hypothetical protein
VTVDILRRILWGTWIVGLGSLRSDHPAMQPESPHSCACHMTAMSLSSLQILSNLQMRLRGCLICANSTGQVYCIQQSPVPSSCIARPLGRFPLLHPHPSPHSPFRTRPSQISTGVEIVCYFRFVLANHAPKVFGCPRPKRHENPRTMLLVKATLNPSEGQVPGLAERFNHHPTRHSVRRPRRTKARAPRRGHRGIRCRRFQHARPQPLQVLQLLPFPFRSCFALPRIR